MGIRLKRLEGRLPNKKAYTVEEVFDRIGYKLADAFGEDFKNKLNKGRAKFDMPPLV